MTAALRVSLLGLILLAAAPAQQLRWQVPVSGPSTVQQLWMGSFVDFDRDGYRDYLRLVRLSATVPYMSLQIASGVDGQTLWNLNSASLYLPSACLAGDMDGDGEPDLAVVYGSSLQRAIEIRSPRTGQVLWQVFGPSSGQYGSALLGDLDVTGDGKPDFVTITSHSSASDVYVYDNAGSLRYTIPCLAQGLIAVSLCKLGDVDGDGADDFVVGCNDTSTRGVQMVVSGRTGATIRQTFGLLPGDRSSAHLSNLGDIDGDGVADYGAWSMSVALAVAYSGQTGNVIRSWFDYGNSVVTGEDFDQDGVNDVVTGADWPVPPNLYGSTRCTSGRDGTELWRIDNVPSTAGSNGSSGWMGYSASLGVQPGSPYPVVAWMDINWWTVATYHGRTRAYSSVRAGQGPVSGSACTSSGPLPLIGVRALPTGSRVTVAKTHGNALAAANFAFAALPTPVDLSAFGFAGCTVYVDPAASYLLVTGTTGIDRGYAAVDLPHPLTAAAVGTDVVAQWLVLEPATGAYAATQMHAIRLQ
jgi:hypothetical protein